MLSNGTHGLVLPAYFELLSWGTFPVFTQRTSCHFITRRFTYFFIEPEPAEDFRVFTHTCRIINTRRFRGISSRMCYRTGHAAESRSSRNSSHFKLSVTFPVSELALRIKRGRGRPRDLFICTGILISRSLDLCQGFTGELSPHSLGTSVSEPIQRGHIFPVFPDSHVTSICVYRTSALGKLSPTISRPVSLAHDRSLGLSPITITRPGLGLSRGPPQGGPFPPFSAKGSTGQAA